MKRRDLLAAFAAAPLFPMLARASSAGPDVVGAANALAADLFGGTTADKNPFISPFSISAALAMTLAGARGKTEKEMRRVMHLPSTNRDAIGAAWNRAIQTISTGDGYELAIANRLFGQSGMRFERDFLQHVKTHFDAPLERLPFASDPNGSRLRVNGWVEKKTKDRIKDLLKQPDVTIDTRLILANAIWFKGKWAREFDKAKTRKADFHVAKGGRVQVDMMRQKAKFAAGKIRGGKVAALPYGKGHLRMVVVLPDNGAAMAGIQRNLGDASLMSWRSRMRDRKVDLRLPRFDGGSRFELSKQLKALGMPTAFTGGADFSGLEPNRELFISKVVHKTFVAVAEEGTEAAAATAVVMTRESAVIEPDPMTFHVDRPFLYLIEDTRTGAVLFMGRMDNPAS